MSLVKHAKRELELAGLFDKDSDYEGMLGTAVLELVEKFSEQGHSGMSASIVRKLFNIVSDFKTINFLTGEDSEWNDVGEGVYQNNRCGEVFKQKDRYDGKPYTIGGKIFSDDGGKSWYTGRESHVVIEFPYNSNTKPERIIIGKEVKKS